MREILFRGKRLDNGEWIEGFYGVKIGDKHYIIVDRLAPAPCCDSYFVDCAVMDGTIGQYIGLKDKNGQKIFEGDLVQAVLPPSISQPSFAWPIMPVVFSDSVFGLQDQRGGVTPFKSFAPRVTFEVMGNVHDNPELLGDLEE